MHRTLLYLSLICLLLPYSLLSQDTSEFSFGQGIINIIARDSTWSTKSTFRFQTQYEGVLDKENVYLDRFRVRRARIKGSGWVTKSRKLRYKYEYDVNNGRVLDAVLMWDFAKKWEVWIGQTKLPGNIERVISSQNMQLVDRSLLNAYFTLDRDGGLQLRHRHTFGKMIVREKFAFSQGEGPNSGLQSRGSSYTARLELLPFGDFMKAGGEYNASDLRRTSTPRLMLGLVFDHNEQAIRTNGHLGSFANGYSRNLATIMADAHLKYRGFSTMLEYAQCHTENKSPVIAAETDNLGNVIRQGAIFYTGWAFNAQSGYLFKNNWEIAGRYTLVRPEKITGYDELDQYTLGVSKYIVGHNLKVQSDVSLLESNTGTQEVMFRLQTEFTF